MVSRFLTAKLAVAALTAVVAVGGVAAAAGVAKTASDHAKAKAVGKVDKAQSERGPDATGHAKAGLCRAWAAGNGRDKGGKAESTAFEALARAAGGPDKVAAFCGAASAEASAGKPEGAGTTGRPEASGAALDGMCKAWASGKGGEQRRQESDAAFQVLIEAAGGAANVQTFCAARTAAGEAGQTSGSTADDKREQHAPAGSERVPDRADQNRPTTDG
jgi:hypothetical protein